MMETRWLVRCYAAAALVLGTGVLAAFASYPDGFDWAYTVVSRLASRKHNPVGGFWLCAALLATMLLLWPTIGRLGRAAAGPHGAPRMAMGALRIGLIGGALLALEGLLMLDLGRIARKAHEALALVTLVGLYAGVIGLYVQRMRHDRGVLLPSLGVLLPLFAVAASQLVLYFGQRELGWVNTSWRELGVPVWLSFAFWQWLAIAVLGAGLGHHVLLATARTAPASAAGETS